MVDDELANVSGARAVEADAGIPDMDPCAGDAALVAPCARDRSSRMKGIVS